MNHLSGWVFRVIGVFLWVFLIAMFKSDNPGWTSDNDRFWFYVITSGGGLICFGVAQALLGTCPTRVDISVGVITSIDSEDG